MKPFIPTCAAFLVATFCISAAAQTPPSLDAAIADLQSRLKDPARYEQDKLYDIVRIFGSAGADAVAALYDRPEDEPIRRNIILTLATANASTPATRKCMLHVEQDTPFVLGFYTFPFLSQHYDDYNPAEQAAILDLCRKFIAKTPLVEKPDIIAMPMLDIVGRHGSAQDMPAIRALSKLPNSAAMIGMRRCMRRTLARLGDDEARTDLLATLASKDGNVVGTSIQDIAYLGDQHLVPQLLPFLSDKRIGEEFDIAGSAFDRITGKALDYLAAHAIFTILPQKPTWTLTAPDGKIIPKGAHPEDTSQMMVSKHYDTLSDAQRDEILTWSKTLERP